MSEGTIPLTLSVGEERRTEINGTPVVLVGTEPLGITAIIEPNDLQYLRAWKLTRLRFMRRRVFACGGSIRQVAARVLTGTVYDTQRQPLYRNGNLFDLRRANLVVAPQSLLHQVRNPLPPHDERPKGLVTVDGKPRGWPNTRHRPSAAQRLEKLLRE